MNYIKDDLVSVINAVIDRRISGLTTYRAKVEKLSTYGYVLVSCNELNIPDDKPESFLLVGSGINSYNFITPDIGDEIEIYFPKGDNSNPQYINIIQKSSDVPLNIKDKYFIKYKDFNIYQDFIDDSLNIESGETKIILNSNGKIEINSVSGIEINSNSGIIPIEKTVLGESLKTELELVKNLLNELQTQITSWVPVPLDGGSALKGNLAVFQSLPIPDFTNILSSGTKNN